jgi:hypothetical protein
MNDFFCAALAMDVASGSRSVLVEAFAVADPFGGQAAEADSDSVPLSARFMPAVVETDSKFCGCCSGYVHDQHDGRTIRNGDPAALSNIDHFR